MKNVLNGVHRVPQSLTERVIKPKEFSVKLRVTPCLCVELLKYFAIGKTWGYLL